MLFSSRIFLAFLALVLLIYYPLPDRGKRWFLLAMSVLFFGFWDPSVLGMLSLCIGANWWAARAISTSGDARVRRLWLGFALAVSFGVLGTYKYYDFFVGEAIALLQLLGWAGAGDDLLLRLVLPAGISFYTFQTVSYTIDVYRRDCEHDPDFWRFYLYIVFFPQLVAGPVERAMHLLPQFSRPFRLDPEMVRRGIFLILLGYIKKSIIADRLARIIAPYYSPDQLQELPSAAVMAACQLLFTCQIYVDFSSYSDIAIGLGLLLGYHIRPNFNLPFVVPSIPERWRRWHLSMSEWFRDYIFIPLGGSRHGVLRTQLNVLIVMFLSGLWHGASTNFVIWGLLNGLTMVGHRALLGPLRAISTRMERHPWSRSAYFYLCCWGTYCGIASINIFFRCPDWSTARIYAETLFFSGWQAWADWAFWEVDEDLAWGFAWVFFVFLAHEGERYFRLQQRIIGRPLVWALCGALSLIWLILFGVEGPQFIYYQF